MQTFFLATDKYTGEAWAYSARPLGCEGSFLAGDGVRSRKWFFQRDAPPPGECWEYRLVRVGEADDKDARIAELEKAVANAENRCVIAGESVKALESKLRGVEDCARELRERLAERSPGVMPECVAELVGAAESKIIVKYSKEKALAKAVRDYYATPGHRWEPVDAEHPITAADVGRNVALRNGGIEEIAHLDSNEPRIKSKNNLWLYALARNQSPLGPTHILRPIAPPFVFDGKRGKYCTDDKTVVRVTYVASYPLPLAIFPNGTWKEVNPDGTFPGGRIVRRAEQ